jgi:hypothetical protein
MNSSTPIVFSQIALPAVPWFLPAALGDSLLYYPLDVPFYALYNGNGTNGLWEKGDILSILMQFLILSRIMSTVNIKTVQIKNKRLTGALIFLMLIAAGFSVL